jgi:hypothetical protein
MADWNTFIARFPEFAGGDPTTGAAKLAEATRQINVPLWGALADDGIYLLTAQKLARSPFGNSAKLSTTDGKTVYDDELYRIRMDVSSGYRAT